MRCCWRGWQRVLSCCLSSHHLPLPSQMNPDYVNQVKNATSRHRVLIWRTHRGQSVISRTVSSAVPQCYCVPLRTERQSWEEEKVRTRSSRKWRCRVDEMSFSLDQPFLFPLFTHWPGLKYFSIFLFFPTQRLDFFVKYFITCRCVNS